MILTLKVVELFSGIGAWKKALENLNIDHKTVLAVDDDKYPMTVYNAIHDTDFEPIDITKLDEKDVPDCDIICYSPPCQSWSAAGKQMGFEDKRGILFFDALRIIEEKKPKYALMENVKNLTQKKFKKEFEGMLELLEEAGYKNYWTVLNAKDFNVPQNRERVFVISIRNDIEQDFQFPDKLDLTKELSDYLDEDATSPMLHNIYGGFKEKTARVFDKYSPTIRTSSGGGHIPSVVIKGCSLKTRNYMGQSQRLEVRKDDLSNTVITVPKDYMIALLDDFDSDKAKEIFEASKVDRSKSKNLKVVVKDGDKYRLAKDKSDIDESNEYIFIREMNTLEAFRLMGFDDKDYEIAKKALNDTFYNGKDRSNTRLYRCAGNSIVVDVCEAIFKELLTI